MKKIVVCGFMLLAAASMSLLSSCSDDKVISSESAVDKSQTATVEIYAKYGAATTSEGTSYQSLTNARMILTAPNSSLGNSKASGNYVQEVTLADKVTISVPVTSKGVDYTASFTDFVANFKEGTADDKPHIFKGAFDGATPGVNPLANLKPGEYRIVKVLYTKSKKVEF
ncbi:MAG: hypothetical protein ACTTKF_02300 [Bacteroides sp.]